LALMVAVTMARLWGLLAGIPFGGINAKQQWWLGVFRAVYGLDGAGAAGA
jgi:hypothetical protein